MSNISNLLSCTNSVPQRWQVNNSLRRGGCYGTKDRAHTSQIFDECTNSCSKMFFGMSSPLIINQDTQSFFIISNFSGNTSQYARKILAKEQVEIS